MLPRIGIFKANRLGIKHMVMIDGDIMKPICVRMPIKNGTLLPPTEEVNCRGCKNKSWTRSLGRFSGGPIKQDATGRYIARENEEKSSILL